MNLTLHGAGWSQLLWREGLCCSSGCLPPEEPQGQLVEVSPHPQAGLLWLVAVLALPLLNPLLLDHRELLEATPSPVVFCHNDVQEGECGLLPLPRLPPRASPGHPLGTASTSCPLPVTCQLLPGHSLSLLYPSRLLQDLLPWVLSGHSLNHPALASVVPGPSLGAILASCAYPALASTPPELFWVQPLPPVPAQVPPEVDP